MISSAKFLISKQERVVCLFSRLYFAVNTLAMTKPDKAKAVENMLVNMAQTRGISGQVLLQFIIYDPCIFWDAISFSALPLLACWRI